jgi:hypothetical protein
LLYLVKVRTFLRHDVLSFTIVEQVANRPLLVLLCIAGNDRRCLSG